MPAILSRPDNSPIKAEDEDKIAEKEISPIIDVQPLPSCPYVSRKDPIHIPIEDDEASLTSSAAPRTILDSLHEEHKNLSPILCLSLLYIFLAADSSWFMMALIQIGIQALFFSKQMLKSPIGSRILMLLSLAMLTSTIISLSLLSALNSPVSNVAQQVYLYFFIIFSFIGFVFTNIYNICILFAFGRSADWLVEVDSDGDREAGF